jgi:hypothetical protein
MEFALLIYGNEKIWEAADEHARRDEYAEHARFSQMLQDRDAMRGGAELTSTSAATTLRRTGDSVGVTDGPFAETAEQLGGFYLIEAPDLDAAIDIARQLPAGTVEVRAVVPMADSAG